MFGCLCEVRFASKGGPNQKVRRHQNHSFNIPMFARMYRFSEPPLIPNTVRSTDWRLVGRRGLETFPILGSLLVSTGTPSPRDLLESWGYGHTTLKIFEE